MRPLITALVMLALAAMPALADDNQPSLGASAARPLYTPWLAVGLNYAPIVTNSTLAAFATDITSPVVLNQSAMFISVNPLPGLGHLYVGEPARGLTFFGTNIGLLVGTVVANVMLYSGPRAADQPIQPQQQLRDGINLTYLVSSSLISAWAAYDAFQIAEEKNRARQKH